MLSTLALPIWHVYCISDFVSVTDTVLLIIKAFVVRAGGQQAASEM